MRDSLEPAHPFLGCRSVDNNVQTSGELSAVLAGSRHASPLTSHLPRIRTLTLVLVCGALAVAMCACRSQQKLPDKSSKEYAEAVSAFYVGLAALQVGDDVHAESKLSELTTLVPGEPAGWANWGVLALRQRKLDAAADRIEKARSLAPDNDQIYQLLGLVESNRGNSAKAIADWRKAIELNPGNYRAAYQLAEEVERQSDANSDAEYQRLIQKILAAQPENLAAELELARVAAKTGDTVALKSMLAQISSRSANWPAEIKAQLAAVQVAADGPNPRTAATRTTFLRNTLMRVPEFRESLAVLKAPPGEEAEPFTHFLRLETPDFTPAPADTSLAFDVKPVANADSGTWTWIGAVALGSAGAPVVTLANGREVRLSTGATFPFPGGSSGIAPLLEGILQIDFNYDFKTDLVLAGAGGVRLMRQDAPDKFTDVTAITKLPKNVTNASYTGAWAVDIEADGDLDIVLGKKDGVPQVLRNNGDDTFTAIQPFPGVSGVQAFAWADFDADGNADAAIVDGLRRLHIFHNERQGQFREVALPANLPTVKALGVADTDNDGVLDLLAVESSGTIVSVSFNEKSGWSVAPLVQIPNPTTFLAGEVRLEVADLDNNGALDLILSSVAPSDARSLVAPLIWLGDSTSKFTLMDRPPGPRTIFDIADLSGDGRLDLLGFDAPG